VRIALALALLLATALPASAGPRVVRVQKGLPGQWPGLALVPDDAEAIGFLSLAPVTAWAEKQGASHVDIMDGLAGTVVGPDVPHELITRGTRSLLVAVATSANRPGSSGGSMTTGLIILGGSYDERALEAALASAFPFSERVAGRALYLRRSGRREPEVIALLPGGIAFGDQVWVKAAVTRLGKLDARPESAPARVARQRIAPAAVAWGALSPGRGTRAQLAPIKPFLATIEGALWMTAPRAEPHATLSLRLSFATPGNAREAASFASQLFGLSGPFAAGGSGLDAILMGAVGTLAGALRVEGSDVVADVSR